MKNLFLLVIFSFVIFQSCAEIDPIISDVCDITSEICYYAEIVCQNFNDDKSENLEKEKVKSALISIANDLKYEATFTADKLDKKNVVEKSEVKYRLIQIRNELKKLADQQLKKE